MTWFGYFVGLVVVLSFSASVVLWVATRRQIPIEIHGLMAIVVGETFVGRLIRKRK